MLDVFFCDRKKRNIYIYIYIKKNNNGTIQWKKKKNDFIHKILAAWTWSHWINFVKVYYILTALFREAILVSLSGSNAH